MKDNFLNTNSYSEIYDVEDWNHLIKINFLQYFPSEALFNKNKDNLRIEIINYAKIADSPEYLLLFNNTIKVFKDLRTRSEFEYRSLLIFHFKRLEETNLKEMRFLLTQPDLTQLSDYDRNEIKLKVLGDVLEGCFLERFKLLYHCQCILNKKEYQDDLDFGEYIANFNDQHKLFSLFISDPVLCIKTNQWRNISSHKSYDIRKDRIELQYGKKKIHETEITYNQLDEIIKWSQLMYRALKLTETIMILSDAELLSQVIVETPTSRIRFEQGLLTIIHNIQIVGFPFVKILEEDTIFSIFLKKKKTENIKDSVIHSSQCLDLLSSSIFYDEYVRDKYIYARIVIVSEDFEELGSSSVKIKELFKKDSTKKLIDYVKFTIGSNRF